MNDEKSLIDQALDYSCSVRLLERLALSGMFHPGQIVMTDQAFKCYNDMHLSVSETFNHGLHYVISEATQVTLKELLPSCLPGRVSAAFSSSPDVQKLSLGFHDAPALPGPMCICFCNISAPQVRLHHVRNQVLETHGAWIGIHVEILGQKPRK